MIACRIKPLFAAPLALAAASLLASCATVPAAPPAAAPVTVKIVGLNDFHGNLEPIRRPLTVLDEAGQQQQLHAAGAAYVATAAEAVREASPYNLTIAAGDLIGSSPLISSLFLDEPAIGAMNRLGLDFNAVGNHEFDRGWRELKRIQQGGCEQLTMRTPCAVETPYAGADFAFLAANVSMPDGSTLFPGSAIKRFDIGGGESVSIGVIGLTLKDTPTLVTPSGVDGLTFSDEAEAINREVAKLESEGVDAVIVAIHQGLYTDVGYNDKSCDGVRGPLLDILASVDPRVDLVISGHTHAAYICDFARIDPSRSFLVTSAGYGGSMLTDITMVIDPAENDVLSLSADNIVIQSIGTDREGHPATPNPAFASITPDPDIAAYVARYAAAAEQAAGRPVGRISGEAKDPGPATEETQLGNLIADAQLAATRSAGAQIALMNNSGIRAGIVPGEDGTLTFGDIYAVQPFGNTLVTKSFTGAQFFALLEQQFDDEGFVQTFSASEGFRLTYDMSRPVGSRVISATLNGQPIDPEAIYRVTMNSFLAAGGDSFTVLEAGTDTVVGPVDLDAMEAYLRAVPLRQLPPIGRVIDATPD